MVIKSNSKILAGTITFIIITLLIILGPARAYILEMTINDNEVIQGEVIKFDIGLKIEGNEFLNLSSFTLGLLGPQKVNCIFDVDGNIVRGCFGILIEKTSSALIGYGYGYGYGFTNGTFEYKITLNSSGYMPGTYKTFLSTLIDGNVVEKQGSNILIIAVPSGLEGCSVRAKDGTLSVEGKNFTRLKISFYVPLYVPLGNAHNGQGSITGSSGKERFSYKFDWTEVLENNQNYSDIRAVGEYNIGREKEKSATVIIHYDKINKKLSMSKDIVLENADVTFMKRC
jgi:hypothetical protein